MPNPMKPYRLFLKLYPARFRENYETLLEQQFRDDYREVHGAWARIRFWLRVFADLAVSIPSEIAHELKLDLSYALRIYRRRAMATALALMALALAIGAATGVFSVVNALLLRSLPFRAAERLVDIESLPVNVFENREPFYAWRKGNAAFEDVAPYSLNQLNLSLVQGAERVAVAETSANFFALLGRNPEFGRAFAPDEDIKGKNAVAVIRHGLWRKLFGGNPVVLGSTIRLNGKPLTVIGVAPPGFDFPNKTDVWTPTVFDPSFLNKSGAIYWKTIGLVKPGLSIAQAFRIMKAEEARLQPNRIKFNQANRVKVESIRKTLAGPVSEASLVLMGLVIFMLLIACANVAHLLLSRTAERRQELALRMALGAGRARLMQQFITESIALTLAASVAGMVVAHWIARLASIILPVQLSAQNYSILDWRVLGFAATAAFLTGVLFGVLPSSLIGRMHSATDTLRIQTGSQGAGVRRMRGWLVAVQAALTMMLLSGALIMGRSFLKLMSADLGFQTRNVITLKVSLIGTPSETESARRRYYNESLVRLRAIPGVEHAGGTAYLPLSQDIRMMMQFKLESGQDVGALLNEAMPDYFRTMKTPLAAGREFADADKSDAPRVVIVNEEFVRQTGIRRSLVGEKIKMSWRGAPDTEYTIVGVVKPMRGPMIFNGAPEVFWPANQSYLRFITFVAYVRGNVQRYIPICRDALCGVDRQVPVYDVMTLDERQQEILAKPRFYTISILFLGNFALLLALIGTFGMAAHSIAQRTREIGIRMAIGAMPQNVRRMLLRQSIIPVALGTLVGILGAFGLGRYLRHLIDSAQPMSAPMYISASAVLVAAAAASIWIASRRITRIDPINVLRAE